MATRDITKPPKAYHRIQIILQQTKKAFWVNHCSKLALPEIAYQKGAIPDTSGIRRGLSQANWFSVYLVLGYS